MQGHEYSGILLNFLNKTVITPHMCGFMTFGDRSCCHPLDTVPRLLSDEANACHAAVDRCQSISHT